MNASESRLAALAGIPLASRHVQGSFGPVTLRLAGARAVLELDDGRTPPLRLTWTDAPDQAIGPRVADLLRTSGTAVFERPGLLRIAGRRKITDPPSSTPDTPQSVQVTTVSDGIRLEIASWPERSPRACAPRNAGPETPAPETATATATARDPDDPVHPVTRAVVLTPTQAHDLADLLEAWAALPSG
ncbi:hypothetical protein [Protofrankia symbiont of Coriaria ruscifolia]|uniref:hypothetical protein n=1 Tax=Protofrankia symbiont of Coriaria ruscifolia TaxID=1306542 RepID=UPI00104173C2|nr:hypothetical protein [Protofrankia symbiont of Coriaria ruscifolia]